MEIELKDLVLECSTIHAEVEQAEINGSILQEKSLNVTTHNASIYSTPNGTAMKPKVENILRKMHMQYSEIIF